MFRNAVPRSIRIATWQWTLRRVFKRFNLDENVPIFSSIEIETRTRCNSACSFCGASVLADKRADLRMPEEMFEKIISELSLIQFAGRIHFFINNEPLLDPRLADLIKIAKARVPLAKTEVQTNGLKLNVINGREILSAGLDVLYINNYSDEGKVPLGVQKFLEEVAPDFPKVQIIFSMRKLNETLFNRAGTAPNATSLSEMISIPCTLPFTDLVITANGKVAICCQDLEFEEVMGNINSATLMQIWSGPAFKKIRNHLKNGDRSVSRFCKGCDFRGFRDESLSGIDHLANRAIGPLF